jgi:hypothetical protein
MVYIMIKLLMCFTTVFSHVEYFTFVHTLSVNSSRKSKRCSKFAHKVTHSIKRLDLF